MDLQAIRYAAMVSKMTFAAAIDAHRHHLQRLGQCSEGAEATILRFLGWSEPREDDFAVEVRLILVASDFSRDNEYMNTRRVIDLFRTLDPEMGIQVAYVFLMIAKHQPIYQRELANKVEFTGSSLSRAISALDKWSWLKRPGLGLISSDVDMMDRRQRILRLTPKGKAFYIKLMEIENSPTRHQEARQELASGCVS